MKQIDIKEKYSAVLMAALFVMAVVTGVSAISMIGAAQSVDDGQNVDDGITLGVDYAEEQDHVVTAWEWHHIQANFDEDLNVESTRITYSRTPDGHSLVDDYVYPSGAISSGQQIVRWDTTGSVTVTVEATLESGTTVSDTFTVDVVNNSAPKLSPELYRDNGTHLYQTSSGDYQLNETLLLHINSSDTDDTDSLNYSIALADNDSTTGTNYEFKSAEQSDWATLKLTDNPGSFGGVEYVFNVTVSDGQSNTTESIRLVALKDDPPTISADSVWSSVLEPLGLSANDNPIYEIGQNQRFWFSASADDEGEIDHINWYVDGELMNVSDQFEWSFATTGVTHNVTAEAVDDSGKRTNDTIEVMVVDGKFSANAGGPYAIAEGQNVTLDARYSSGNISSYDWTLTDPSGNNQHTINTTNPTTVVDPGALADDWQVSETGTWAIDLKVTNQTDSYSWNSTNLTVENNSPPTTSAGEDLIAIVNESVVLNGSVSDADGDQLVYEWSIVSTPQDADPVIYGSSTVEDLEVEFGELGEYSVALTAEDEYGQTATDTVNVSVSENSAPTVEILIGNFTPDAGQSINISTDVYDPDGDAVSNPDGQTVWTVTSKPSGATVSFDDPYALETNASFSENGTYELTSTIEDENGVTALDTAVIDVGNTAGGGSNEGDETTTATPSDDGSDDGDTLIGGDGSSGGTCRLHDLSCYFSGWGFLGLVVFGSISVYLWYRIGRWVVGKGRKHGIGLMDLWMLRDMFRKR